jgi:hypothetical protein
VKKISRAIKLALVLALCYVASSSASVSRSSALSPDVFWLDSYGALRWEDEKARLDNFAIQLTEEKEFIGYIYIYAGNRSCAGEAITHAIKARRYLTEVRHLPWDRVAFRDNGYRDSFEVKLWLFRRGTEPFVPDYEPPTPQHVIQKCSAKKPRSRK